MTGIVPAPEGPRGATWWLGAVWFGPDDSQRCVIQNCSTVVWVLIIHPHARDHGVADEVVEAVWNNAVDAVFYRHDDGSLRWVVLGADSAGNMLETVWLDLGTGDFLAVHCQRLRKATIRLMEQIKDGN